jgi:hypothetical protein
MPKQQQNFGNWLGTGVANFGFLLLLISKDNSSINKEILRKSYGYFTETQ